MKRDCEVAIFVSKIINMKFTHGIISFSIFDFSKPVSINLLVSLTPTPSAFFHLYVPPQDILMLIVVLLALQRLERINQKFPKMCTVRTSISKYLELSGSFKSSQQKLIWNYLNCICHENNFQKQTVVRCSLNGKHCLLFIQKFFSILAANQQILNE